MARSSCALHTSPTAGPAAALWPAAASCSGPSQRLHSGGAPARCSLQPSQRLPSSASSKWLAPAERAERWVPWGLARTRPGDSGSWSFHQVPLWDVALDPEQVGDCRREQLCLLTQPRNCLSLRASERTPRGAAICLRSRSAPPGWSSPVARAAAGPLA